MQLIYTLTLICGLFIPWINVCAAIDEKPSQLDYLIPPEIYHDKFYDAIYRFASTTKASTILEIGSSSGEGSTSAFVKGIKANPNGVTLFCTELSKPRFNSLQNRYKNDSFVKCYNVSTVPVESFPSEEELTYFYNNTPDTSLRGFQLYEVIGWLRQDIRYIQRESSQENGIELIKRENNIENFGAVLIDGSEFTGMAELDEVYGADFILLDDIRAFKNYNNYERLKADSNYTLIEENKKVRYGYAIFEKVNNN